MMIREFFDRETWRARPGRAEPSAEKVKDKEKEEKLLEEIWGRSKRGPFSISLMN